MVLQAGRIFNTWMGDPARVMLLETTVRVIEEQDLLQNVRNVGAHLTAGMHNLQVSPHAHKAGARVGSRSQGHKVEARGQAH